MANFKDHLRQLEGSRFYLPNKPNGFSDADGAIFFARQLEYIESQVYNVLYQDLKYRSIFPVDSSVPVGVKQIGYWSYDKAGKAKWINTSAKDLPRVDIAGKETLLPVHWAGNSFGYNIGEIASAQFAGVPLNQMKADAARRVHEENLNETCWFGNSDNGLVGFFSAGTGIPQAAAPNGASTSPLWTSKTPDEIVADVNNAFSDPVENTLEKERPTHLGLPTKQYNLLGSTRMTDTGETLWSYLMKNSPWITGPDNIVSIPELKNAIGGSSDALITWTRNPAKIEQKIPQDIVFHPVQQVGLEWIVNVTVVYGGLHIRYPLSANIVTGI